MNLARQLPVPVSHLSRSARIAQKGGQSRANPNAVVGQFEIGCLGRSLRRPRFLVFWGIAKPLPQAPFATSNQMTQYRTSSGSRLLTLDYFLRLAFRDGFLGAGRPLGPAFGPPSRGRFLLVPSGGSAVPPAAAAAVWFFGNSFRSATPHRLEA